MWLCVLASDLELLLLEARGFARLECHSKCASPRMRAGGRGCSCHHGVSVSGFLLGLQQL